MSEVFNRFAKKFSELRGCTLNCTNTGLGCVCFIEAANLLREMREPDEAMIKRGYHDYADGDEQYTSETGIVDAWRAMIDEAVK